MRPPHRVCRVRRFFFAFGGLMFRAFFVGTTQTRTLTLNSIVMVLCNVAFNYLLIFGRCGLPALGITGAAIGSSLAEGVSLLFFIVHTRRHIDLDKYGLRRIPGFSSTVLRRMLNVSLWTMIQNFVSLSTWFLLFLYIEHLGERPLAITNIIRNVSGLLFMVMMAFASTCGSLVSNLIGSGHPEAVRPMIHRHILLGYAFVLPLALLISLFPDQVLSIYTDMAELRIEAVPSLYVLCTAYLLLVPANVYFHSVSGTGNTRTALFLELSTLVFYVAYITYIVAIRRYSVAVAWTSEHFYSICILTLCYLYIRSGRWQGKSI